MVDVFDTLEGINSRNAYLEKFRADITTMILTGATDKDLKNALMDRGVCIDCHEYNCDDKCRFTDKAP